METLIREYTATDRENCLVAFKSNVPLYFAEHEIGLFNDFLEKLSLSENYTLQGLKAHYFVIEISGKIIGCGGFGERLENPEELTLIWGFVHRNYHKMGFGKELLLFRLRQMNELYPQKPVAIDTTQHSAGFFEKYGFVTSEITENYYADGMHRYDMVWNPGKKDYQSIF